MVHLETTDNNSMVTNIEKVAGRQCEGMSTKDEQQLRRAELDDTDNEGEPLNEKPPAMRAAVILTRPAQTRMI